MKFIQYLKFAVVVLFTQVLFSCKKSFLNVPANQQIIAEDYLQSLSRAEEILNGIYFLLAKNIYNYQNIIYADVVADNVKPLGSNRLFLQNSYTQIADETSLTSNANNMNSLWVLGYKTIRSCNFLLEHIDQFRGEDPLKADAIKGQAYTIRALTHHILVNVFAQPYGYTTNASHPGIPYDTVFAQTQVISRQPVSEVYDHMIADLLRAEQLIPASLNNLVPAGINPKTWINKNAAKALLARVYLFKAEFAKAKSAAREIATAVSIIPNSEYISKLFTANDSEALFWLAPVQPAVGEAVIFEGYVFGQTNFYAATADLVNIIKQRPSDIRNNWFALMTGNNWQIKKFPSGSISGIILSGTAYYQTVVRSSEMYLTAAEAYANLGNEDSARFYLDAIRKRADLASINTTATGPALLDSIYKERRKELCFENLRMFDLLRWKKGVNRVDVLSPAPTTLSYPNDRAISPIPINDVLHYGLQQNAGY